MYSQSLRVNFFRCLLVWLTLVNFHLQCNYEYNLDPADGRKCCAQTLVDFQTFLAKGYGVADVDSQSSVTGESLFLIASLTKAFAGVSAAIVLKNTPKYVALRLYM